MIWLIPAFYFKPPAVVLRLYFFRRSVVSIWKKTRANHGSLTNHWIIQVWWWWWLWWWWWWWPTKRDPLTFDTPERKQVSCSSILIRPGPVLSKSPPPFIGTTGIAGGISRTPRGKNPCWLNRESCHTYFLQKSRSFNKTTTVGKPIIYTSFTLLLKWMECIQVVVVGTPTFFMGKKTGYTTAVVNVTCKSQTWMMAMANLSFPVP